MACLHRFGRYQTERDQHATIFFTPCQNDFKCSVRMTGNDARKIRPSCAWCRARESHNQNLCTLRNIFRTGNQQLTVGVVSHGLTRRVGDGVARTDSRVQKSRM